MKKLITWCVANSRAMNIIVIAFILIGALSVYNLRRETFPAFKLEIVLVSVPYPGATPAEIEEGICRKIEEAVSSLEGIKKITSVAREGAGSVICELHSSTDPQRSLNEIKNAVDRIPSFPELAERPKCQQITFREPAIRVAVLGGGRTDSRTEWDLRELAESIRDELLLLPSVTDVTLSGRDYQIDVEIPESSLQRHNLTLSQVAEIIRQRNLELPAGNLRTTNNDFLLRGKNEDDTGVKIAETPVLTTPEGTILTVNDLGKVRDGFVDRVAESMVNGRPALNLTVNKATQEDLLQICQEVQDYVKRKNSEMPEGYELLVWDDSSKAVRERLEMLGTNALQGLLIVFVMLSLFLEIRLAFWVSMGIPISILGACAVCLYAGQTLNMVSMFAFLMVLGIVVDDAIVIGENIYTHRQKGKSPVRAAIDGAAEVGPSVLASVTTTVVCFLPMFFVSGIMGKFISVMPLAIIASLVISLLESTYVFPCHLSHIPNDFRVPAPVRWLGLSSAWRGLERIREGVDRLFQAFLDRYYLPSIRATLRHPAMAYSITLFFLLGTWSLVIVGKTPFEFFPKVDADALVCQIVYPTGTPGEITREAVQRLEDAALRANEHFKQLTGEDLIKVRFRSIGAAENPNRPEPLEGSHVGQVQIEIMPAEERNVTSDEFIEKWRSEAGDFPGLEEPPTFQTTMVGPRDKAIEFKMLGNDIVVLEKAVDVAKQALAKKAGVVDIQDDSNPGSWEITLKVKPEAQALGITEAQLYQTVRAAYYGEEVKRIQRDRHEIKLMVRYPQEDRRSLAEFNELRVRTAQGNEIPITEVADVSVEQGYSEINRIERKRSVTVTAEIEKGVAGANASLIVEQLKQDAFPGILEKYPGTSVRWEGQQQQSEESINSMKWGYLIALMANFVLLTIEFKSYTQSIIIFCCIPLGTAGAIIGHVLWGMPITMFSIFGLVALAGIVVNDSIVLVDWINRLVGQGIPLSDALPRAGRERFRPIMLTSITTIGGLAPLLLEQSVQAQILVPMALTISFGLLSSTVATLFVIPVMYQSWYRLTKPRTVEGHVEDEVLDEIIELEREDPYTYGHAAGVEVGPAIHRVRRPAANRGLIARKLLPSRLRE